MLEEYSKWMKGFEKEIVSFYNSIWNGNVETVLYKGFKPFREGQTKLEDGCVYLTIRCGLGGIYTVLNTWKNNKWSVGCLDNSYTIAYRELKDYEKFKDDGKSKETAEMGSNAESNEILDEILKEIDRRLAIYTSDDYKSGDILTAGGMVDGLEQIKNFILKITEEKTKE